MIFNEQIVTTLDDIRNSELGIVFHGKALDDRGVMVVQSINNSNFPLILEVFFNPEKMSFSVNGEEVTFRLFEKMLDEKCNGALVKIFTLEATTLSIAELLYIFRWIKGRSENAKVRILYAEPENYSSKIDTQSDFGKHQFDLSNDSHGYIALPGFTKTVGARSKSHLIALLGFERVRLGQLLSNDEGAYIDGFTPVFGVPGFKPRYDKYSIFHNIDFIVKNGEKPHFCGANSPFATYQLLCKIKESLPGRIINIAPIGTKPMAIGACLFLIESMRDTGLMYDHPYKKPGRSKGVSRVHSFNVTL